MSDGELPEPQEPSAAWADPPGMGKTIGTGVAIGVAVSFLGVAGAFLAAGAGWLTAIGMGAFVATWGGLGFGGMIGGVVWATRVEDAEDVAPRDV